MYQVKVLVLSSCNKADQLLEKEMLSCKTGVVKEIIKWSEQDSYQLKLNVDASYDS